MKKSSQIILGQSTLQKISWKITSVKSLASLPRRRTTPYRFQFEIWNHYDHPIELSVRVESPSKVMIFREKTAKMMGGSRLVSVVDSTFRIAKHNIPSQEKKRYQFSTIFRPHFARPLRPFLVLQYHIEARHEERNFYLRSDPYRLAIPISKQKTT
ncbi:MAG: hypothetical protein ACFE9D_06745 [Promethearchaeota archaeon]